MNRKLYWGIGILLIFVISATIYQVISDQKEIAELKREPIIQQISNQDAKQLSVAEETEFTKAPAETQNAEKPITTQDNEISTTTTQDNNVIAETTEPVRMSPYGLGPYPEIPPDSPIGPFLDTDNINHELIGRVLVKLWNDGDRELVGGGVYQDGKVYPHYKNVIYVKHETVFNEITDEYETKITEATSTYENFDVLKLVMSGNTPSGYKLIDADESGYNPYEFLDLP